MDYLFLSSLEHLQIDKPIGQNWVVVEPLHITNSSSYADRLVTDNFSEAAGKLEARELLSGRPFVYARDKYPQAKHSQELDEDIIDRFLGQLQNFFSCLWLVKDNAVNFDKGYIQCPFPIEGLSLATRVTSLGRGIYFSDARADVKEAAFSVAQLKQAVNYFNELFSPIVKNVPLGKTTIAPQKNMDRASRVFYFLQAARQRATPPEKIAFYCTCFEALVSTETTELSHQVAERVAVLLGKDEQERVRIYKDIKGAYNTRSKLVHGGLLNPDPEKYVDQSVICDDYLRKLITLCMKDDRVGESLQHPSVKVNDFFLHELFRA